MIFTGILWVHPIHTSNDFYGKIIWSVYENVELTNSRFATDITMFGSIRFIPLL